MRLFPIVVVMGCTAALAGASSASAYTFLGWHPSGAFYFQVVQAPKVQVCREDKSDVPTGWPEGTSVGPGIACADMPDTVAGKPALEYAKAELKGTKNVTKSPFGVDVKAESAGGKTVVTAKNGDVASIKVGEAPVDALKLGDTFWRPDGGAVVVTLKADKAKDAAHWFHADLSKLLVGGPVGRKLAEQRHAKGQALYKKRDWSGAGKQFEDAITADPEWAPARYARAAAEAQGGVGRTAMIENLEWLKTRSDKDASAKKLLAQAKDDPAFDAWVGEPEVRELIGLPKVSTLDVTTRLLERKGTWTLQGATCSRPWYTLAFKKGGGATLTIAESCKGKKSSKSTPATFKASATGPFELDVKKPIEGATFPAKSILVLDESYQQLKLQPASGDSLGPFEPGAARIDDSTL